ncbi:hypothetical protein [Turicibacter sanguinis]|jgi:hypothetical protein|uniref:hypothetical protein n=1 Tax=Turicibacter sanguinis TaxID=154288 RepID=UPI00325A5C54
MLNTVNMAELFKKANSYKVDSTEDVKLVGGKRRLTPCLPKGEMLGVIKEVITKDDNSYIQLVIEIEHNNKTHSLKKTLFWRSYSDSEYVLTLAMLLDTDSYSFNPYESFNKNLLMGKVVKVEMSHKKLNSGDEISEITKIIEEMKPTIEHMAI